MKQPEFKTAGSGVGQFYKGKSKNDFEGAELRAIAFAEYEGGHRVMYDTIVQMEPDADVRK